MKNNIVFVGADKKEYSIKPVNLATLRRFHGKRVEHFILILNKGKIIKEVKVNKKEINKIEKEFIQADAIKG